MGPCVSILKKNHRSHDYACTNNDENIVTGKVLYQFNFFNLEMEFLQTKIKTSLSRDRQKFLETNQPVHTTVEELEVLEIKWECFLISHNLIDHQ